MKNYISKILYILPGGQSGFFYIIVILTLLSAIFELVSIGLIIPLLSMFFEDTNLKFLEQLPFLGNMENGDRILFILFLLLIVFIIKNLFLFFVYKKKINFAQNLGALMMKKMYSRYIRKNYIDLCSKNSSELIRNISGEANLFSLSIVFSLINLISDLIIFISIIFFLFVYNFLASTIATSTILIFGIAIILFQQNKLKLWGRIRLVHTNAIIKLIQESFGNIKEIILSNNFDYLVNKFSFHAMENAKAGKKKDFYFIVPRPVLEVIVVFMMMILVYVFLKKNQTTSEIFVIMGVFSFASIKLIPAITNIMRSVQGLKYNSASLDILYNELKNAEEGKKIFESKDYSLSNFEFEKIEIKNISFTYPNKEDPVLNGVNFEIFKGDKIGFLGETGCGKTTLINLIAGLVTPSSGEILINNENMNKLIKTWQDNIGYVSQNVYLADQSLAFNIAFKSLEKKIDKKRIEYLIDILNLKDFIKSQSDGLETTVGENGVKLSGGQLQRIGIARALYSKPNILILDEATNALDLETQDFVIKNIYSEMEKKTILSISHDINSLKKCSKIFKLSDSKVEIIKI